MSQEHGSIRRTKKGVVVRYGDQIKIFKKKPIFLPDEYESAVKQNLVGNDVVVLGMNGYSSLKPEQCKAWGVKPGAYEAACKSLLYDLIMSLQDEFPGIDIRLAHGASNMGVDACIVEVGRRLNLTQLGHSCPNFMLYVEDDDIPVYVAESREAYANSFITSLDILIGANGRFHSFMHDIDAVFKKLKYLIPVNVLKTISTTGGPPAIGPNGEIEDAVAAFEQRVHLVATQMGIIGSDHWKVLKNHLNETTVSICRQLLSPERAFYSL